MEEEMEFYPPYEDYELVMNTVHKLFDQITLWAEENKSKGFPYVASRFGKKHGPKIRLEFKDDINFIRNFHVAEKINGPSEAEKFYDSEVELSELEEEVLEAILDGVYGYFKVIKTDEKFHTEVALTDMLTKKSYTCHSYNLCNLASPDDLFFGRLLPFRDAYLIGGAAVLFGKEDLKLLKRKFSFLKIKKPRLDAFDLCDIAMKYRFQSQFGELYSNKTPFNFDY